MNLHFFYFEIEIGIYTIHTYHSGGRKNIIYLIKNDTHKSNKLTSEHSC